MVLFNDDSKLLVQRLGHAGSEFLTDSTSFAHVLHISSSKTSLSLHRFTVRFDGDGDSLASSTRRNYLIVFVFISFFVDPDSEPVFPVAQRRVDCHASSLLFGTSLIHAGSEFLTDSTSFAHVLHIGSLKTSLSLHRFLKFVRFGGSLAISSWKTILSLHRF